MSRQKKARPRPRPPIPPHPSPALPDPVSGNAEPHPGEAPPFPAAADLGEHLPEVRAQYEAFPYPPRDPQAERQRLLQTLLDRLERVNHHLFGGRLDFRREFSVLVAGGGTGDSLIHLAEQLRDSEVRLVYLDLSAASLELARARAAVRGLARRIEWHHASLLELPRLGLGRFDYINCTGVLHHLEQPAAGLLALREVLAEGGGLGLMLYGRIGRTGVYQLQELLRLLQRGHEDPGERLTRARAVVEGLPATNWFKRAEDLTRDHLRYGEAGLQDMLLHTHDRAYTVPELHELLSGAGLHLVSFELPLRYRPETYLADPRLLADLEPLTPLERAWAAEQLAGNLITHTFYASTRPDCAARFDDHEQVPFLLNRQGTVAWTAGIARLMEQNPGKNVDLTINGGSFRLRLKAGRHSRALFEAFDGQRCIGELVEQARQASGAPPGVTDQEILAELVELLETLASADLVALAHRSLRLPYQKLARRMASQHPGGLEE